MAEDPALDRITRRLQQESHRGLGDIPLRAQAALSPFSRAQMEAAGNLLDKALLALVNGNEDRATQLVERAVALPYDEVERARPAAWMAHMAMFMVVTDAAEDDEGEGEGEDWLDAVVDTLASASDEARFCLRDCLTAIDQDYTLTGPQRQRIRELMAQVSERAPLHDLDVTPAQLVVAVVEILEGVVIYEDAYEELVTLAELE